ncbi:MAG: aspartate aminotransferase family protein [Anaerolineae bacterium]|nr:aspartate aminotransferase family protein [Anaerolineae bacterium]
MTTETGEGQVFTLDPTRDYRTLVRGEGNYVFDDQGKRYLDGAAGVAVVNIGHARREVAEAMAKQAETLAYCASNIFQNEPAQELAARLGEHMPGDLKYFQFTSGGSEAVEVCLKLARQVQVERGNESKYMVIGRWTSYHGASLGALAVTGMPGRRAKFAPMLTDMPHIPPVYCYRCPFHKTYPSCGMACAHALEDEIKRVGPENVAAFIAEPVVGSAGGCIVPPPEYFPIIREICDRYDVLLIADEVITAFGRIGAWTGVEYWGVVPDLMAVAKGMSSGYTPLGAAVATERIRNVFVEKGVAFDHIFTYSANPLSAAVGLAVLDIVEQENLTQNAAEVGAYTLELLSDLQKHPTVGDVRGLGLMIGIEFVQDKGTREPLPTDLRFSKQLGLRALDKGLVTYPGAGSVDGKRGDHVSLYPPLTLTRQDADLMYQILDETIGELEHELLGL